MSVTNFRIYNQNYADVDLLANYDFSSENVNFPVLNVFSWQRRSKVWRTSGYWNITNDTRVIKFAESTGVWLTALLNTGEYSAATLAAELKRAMDDAGASTYTVTYDTTYKKFKFVSNGVGGTGVFDIDFAGSTIAADICLTADKTGALTYYMDKVCIHGIDGEWILFDMGVSTNPDAIFVIDQKQSSIKVTPNATIKIEANITNNFSAPAFSATIPHDDEVLSYQSTTGMATTGYRYWRLSIKDQQNPLGYIQAGSVFIGNFMQPLRGRANFPLNQTYIDKTETIFAESGASFSDIKYKTQSFSVAIKGLQKSDIEEFDEFFNTYGTGQSFFVSMDSSTAFSSNVNRRIIFCKFDNAPKYTLESPDNFNLDMTLREEL